MKRFENVNYNAKQAIAKASDPPNFCMIFVKTKYFLIKAGNTAKFPSPPLPSPPLPSPPPKTQMHIDLSMFTCDGNKQTKQESTLKFELSNPSMMNVLHYLKCSKSLVVCLDLRLLLRVSLIQQLGLPVGLAGRQSGAHTP